MTDFLVKLFVKDYENYEDFSVREEYGIFAGIVGIASNVFLFLLKFAVGLLSGSLAIMIDAFNNLMDSASSLITLIGFKMAGRPADKEHPYGHARSEYIATLFVSQIVVFVGVQFLLSSIQKIKSAEATEMNFVLFALMAVSILMKVWQGGFNQKLGKKIDSGALLATAKDSFNDVIITGLVVVSTVIEMVTGFQIDGWAGAIIAVYILYSGGQMVVEVINELIGRAPDSETVAEIEAKMLSYDGIIGYHELMLHDYGPGRKFGSVHIEVPAEEDILVSHDIIDNIEKDFFDDMDIKLVIHMDPVQTDEKTLSFGKKIQEIIHEVNPKFEMHDFRMVEGKTHTNLIFDLSIPVQIKLRESKSKIIADVQKKVREAYPNHYCVIDIHRDYTGNGI